MDFFIQLFCEIAQKPGQEPGTHILKGQRGTMEQLQCIESLFHLDQRGIKVDGFFGESA